MDDDNEPCENCATLRREVEAYKRTADNFKLLKERIITTEYVNFLFCFFFIMKITYFYYF